MEVHGEGAPVNLLSEYCILIIIYIPNKEWPMQQQQEQEQE